MNVIDHVWIDIIAEIQTLKRFYPGRVYWSDPVDAIVFNKSKYRSQRSYEMTVWADLCNYIIDLQST